MCERGREREPDRLYAQTAKCTTSAIVYYGNWIFTTHLKIKYTIELLPRLPLRTVIDFSFSFLCFVSVFNRPLYLPFLQRWRWTNESFFFAFIFGFLRNRFLLFSTDVQTYKNGREKEQKTILYIIYLLCPCNFRLVRVYSFLLFLRTFRCGHSYEWDRACHVHKSKMDKQMCK